MKIPDKDNASLKELLGKKYGHLIITGCNKEESRRLHQIMLECTCDCGNEHALVAKYRLLSGVTTTCGHCDEFRLKDKIVGNYKVLGKNPEVSKKRNRTFWDCQCIKCGYIKPFCTHDIDDGIANNYLPCNKCASLNRRNNTIDKMMERKIFGYMEVLCYDKDNSTSTTDKYICKCTRCGKVVYNVKGDNLRQGITQSCGCLRYNKTANETNKDLSKFNTLTISKEEKSKEPTTQYVTSTQLDYNMNSLYKKQKLNPEACEEEYYRSILRQTHRKMINRTTNESDKNYDKYGAVGRDVSPDWEDFENFYNDVVDTYKKAEKMYPGIRLNIDRINNNLGYSNTNFRFVPTMVNSNNSNNNNLYEYCDQIWDSAMLARTFGVYGDVNDNDIRNRLAYGWTLEEAITIPRYKPRSYNQIISPIYFVDDIKEKHKLSQGISREDKDYMYNDGSIEIDPNNIKDSLEQIVEHNKFNQSDSQSGGLFGHLKDLGKQNS